MITNARTIYYNNLVLSAVYGTPFKATENTTLNEKFGIAVDTTTLAAGVYPTLKYFAIGNGNATSVLLQTDGYMHRNNHDASHAALYNHIPFIARPVDADLSASERTAYRMRVVTDIGGTEYAFYYMKTLPTDEIATNYLVVEYALGGSIDISVYQSDPVVLSPVMHEANADVDSEVNRSIVISKKMPFILTTDDLAEIKSAVTLIVGEENLQSSDYAINELAVCSGLDISDGVNNEVSRAQVAFFVDIDYDVETTILNGESINRDIELAGVDRLSFYNPADETVVTG